MCDPIRPAGKTQLNAELDKQFAESLAKHMIVDNTRSLNYWRPSRRILANVKDNCSAVGRANPLSSSGSHAERERTKSHWNYNLWVEKMGWWVSHRLSVTGINIIAATHKAQTSWRFESMWNLSRIQPSQGDTFSSPEIHTESMRSNQWLVVHYCLNNLYWGLDLDLETL